MSPSETSAASDGRRQVLLTLWVTYGAFYFCRANISPAVPQILADVHLTKTDMGYILGGTKLAYALGQLVNGQIANRVDARRMLAAGMLLSIAMNVLFGFATGFYVMLFVWFVNGYAQSMGWPPAVKVMAHWFPPLGRGRAMGILGTSYQISSAVTLLGAGALIVWLGSWRAVFWVSSALFAAVLVYMMATLRPEPPAAAPPAGAAASRESPVSLGQGLAAALRNPRIWLFGLALGAIDIIRYGFLDWAPTLLKEVQGTRIDSAALKTAVVPLGGALGAFVSGWVSDRFFGGRRAPVIAAMLVALAVLTALTERAVHAGSMAATVIVFGLAGCMIYGPQVMLVGTLPQDFSDRRVVAGACGFVNAMGYLGAWVGDVATGKVAHLHGWGAVLAFWNATAVAAALLVIVAVRLKPGGARPREAGA